MSTKYAMIIPVVRVFITLLPSHGAKTTVFGTWRSRSAAGITSIECLQLRYCVTGSYNRVAAVPVRRDDYVNVLERDYAVSHPAIGEMAAQVKARTKDLAFLLARLRQPLLRRVCQTHRRITGALRSAGLYLEEVLRVGRNRPISPLRCPRC